MTTLAGMDLPAVSKDELIEMGVSAITLLMEKAAEREALIVELRRELAAERRAHAATSRMLGGL